LGGLEALLPRDSAVFHRVLTPHLALFSLTLDPDSVILKSLRGVVPAVP
jgi:hypothetical protein